MLLVSARAGGGQNTSWGLWDDAATVVVGGPNRVGRQWEGWILWQWCTLDPSPSVPNLSALSSQTCTSYRTGVCMTQCGAGDFWRKNRSLSSPKLPDLPFHKLDAACTFLAWLHQHGGIGLPTVIPTSELVQLSQR